MEALEFHECSHKLYDNENKEENLFVNGAIAQLGERLPCTQEVSSSILLSSTIYSHSRSLTLTLE
jgi:hypothetical protein